LECGGLACLLQAGATFEADDSQNVHTASACVFPDTSSNESRRKISDRTIELISPPITVMASGLSISEPAPIPNASGNMPAIVASAVIAIGRKRRRPLESSLPPQTVQAAESVLRIKQQNAFFATIQ